MERFKNKVVLITGGGSGIGAATARRLSREGASVAVMGRRLEPLQRLAKEIQGIAIAGDVTQEADNLCAVETTVKHFGCLNVVVTCAGVVHPGPAAELDLEDWRQTVGVNLEGTFLITRAAIPAMKRSGGGAIVVVSSIGALIAAPGLAAYPAAKAGVLGYTRSLAVDYGPCDIRANTILPGWVKTDMSDAAIAYFSEASGRDANTIVERFTRHQPIARMAESKEIAACIAFLASDDASFVTGTTLIADGGGHIVNAGMIAATELVPG